MAVGITALACRSRWFFRRSTRTSSTRPQGMNITLVTTAHSDDDARVLLRAMGLPMKKTEKEGGTAA